MDIIDVIGLASSTGTVICLFTVIDSVKDVRAAQGNTDLEAVSKPQLLFQIIFLLAQLVYLAVALIARFRQPDTFQQTLRYLLVAVPILLAIGSVVSWHSKRRLLADTRSQ
jgi:hypothetical protein